LHVSRAVRLSRNSSQLSQANSVFETFGLCGRLPHLWPRCNLGVLAKQFLIPLNEVLAERVQVFQFREERHPFLLHAAILTARQKRMPYGDILISVPFPQFQPLPLSRARAPFSHPDWIFEVKWDGFRALLHSDADGVRLVSRNGNTFKFFPSLCEGLARDLKGRRCVLDGEIVCLDCQGKPLFTDLLFRREEPLFYAFDILWDEHGTSDNEEEALTAKCSLPPAKETETPASTDACGL
jgi:ATP dependent DNA ligase domain